MRKRKIRVKQVKLVNRKVGRLLREMKVLKSNRGNKL